MTEESIKTKLNNADLVEANLSRTNLTGTMFYIDCLYNKGYSKNWQLTFNFNYILIIDKDGKKFSTTKIPDSKIKAILEEWNKPEWKAKREEIKKIFNCYITLTK